MTQDRSRDAAARHRLQEIMQAITGIDPPERVERLLAEARRELREPQSYRQFRAAAEIARLGLVFVHDRRGDGADAAAGYLSWTRQLVEDPGTPLSDDFLLLAEAIDSGKRGDASGVLAVAGLALSRGRVRSTLNLLDDDAAHPEAKDLAVVQLRLVAEVGRALRMLDVTAASLRASEMLVDVMDALEQFAEPLSGFAMYRARLSVAYVQRDLEGDWADASRRLQRALDNRERCRRTELTVPLHQASLMRIEASVDRGQQRFEIARSVEAQARLMEDECLDALRSLGFRRHVESFLRFRRGFDA